jgi:transcriptional regulator with XRE-family HTH domain
MQASFPNMPYSALIMSAATKPTNRLRELREAAGLTLRELARQLGEDHSNVGYWERTGTLPRSNVLVPMAAALGVTVEELLGQDKPRRTAAPGGKVRSVFEQVQKLPRRRQDKIVEVVEALLKAS